MLHNKPFYIRSVIMIVLSIIMLVPFFMMINTSLKTPAEIISSQFQFFPKEMVFGNYIEALSSGDWGRYFFNTFYITVVSVFLAFLINSLAGYSFARLDFPGRNILFVLSLVGLMVPPQVRMIPVFLILKTVPFAGGNNFLGQGGIGLMDTYTGVIIPLIAGSFGLFMYRQFFLNFPKELDEAAEIDGLGKFGTYVRIYLPLSKPVIATHICLKTTMSWNEYIWPLLLINDPKKQNVQLGLQMFRDEYTTQWHLLMAVTTVSILPLALLFLFAQKYFVSGITTSGIKG